MARKKFAYTETLSSTGGKNISLPGIGEISEAKMMFAIIIIIFGFMMKASLQLHIAILLLGLVVLAIPETSVGFHRTLNGMISYYFGKKDKPKKVKATRRSITIPKIDMRKVVLNYGQEIAGTLLTIAGIEIFEINYEDFIFSIVFIAIGLGLVLADFISKVVKK